jgi:hypothetical protein
VLTAEVEGEESVVPAGRRIENFGMAECAHGVVIAGLPEAQLPNSCSELRTARCTTLRRSAPPILPLLGLVPGSFLITAPRDEIMSSEGRARRNATIRGSATGRRSLVTLHNSPGSGAKLVGIGSGVISGLKFTKPMRRLAAAEGDNANDERYSKRAGW